MVMQMLIPIVTDGLPEKTYKWPTESSYWEVLSNINRLDISKGNNILLKI